MNEGAGNPFWSFSLTLYMRAGVGAACLDLQDRFDLDVNLLLYCCWAGSQGRALSETEIARLIAATRDWRDQVIQPLRGARRWLKANLPGLGAAAAELREDIKASELAAEAIQQNTLYRTLRVPVGQASPDIVAGNLRSYIAVELGQPAPQTLDALATLLCGAAPELDPFEARRLLTGGAFFSLPP